MTASVLIAGIALLLIAGWEALGRRRGILDAAAADARAPNVRLQRYRIFVSYRREVSAGHLNSLRLELLGHFGKRQVFLDTEIEFGDKWRGTLRKELASSAVVLVLIGPKWSSVADPTTGKRRLEDENDTLRFEIAHALDSEALVIPVLVGGAAMPDACDLPAEIAGLREREAVRLNDGVAWKADVGKLMDRIAAAPGVILYRPVAALLVGLATAVTLYTVLWVLRRLAPLMMPNGSDVLLMALGGSLAAASLAAWRYPRWVPPELRAGPARTWCALTLSALCGVLPASYRNVRPVVLSLEPDVPAGDLLAQDPRYNTQPYSPVREFSYHQMGTGLISAKGNAIFSNGCVRLKLQPGPSFGFGPGDRGSQVDATLRVWVSPQGTGTFDAARVTEPWGKAIEEPGRYNVKELNFTFALRADMSRFEAWFIVGAKQSKVSVVARLKVGERSYDDEVEVSLR